MKKLTSDISASSSPPDNSKNHEEELLLERFRRKRFKRVPIKYEFTQDRALLHLYYVLRQEMYRRTYGSCEFPAQEDLHDKISYTLIARRGNLVVGGCRLTVREADEKFPLPMETDNFNLREVFRGTSLDLDKHKHGEMSRFAVMNDFKRNREVMIEMSRIIIQKAINLKLKCFFLKSNYLIARNWRMIANHLQLENEIMEHIKVPPPPHSTDVKWYLCAGYVNAEESEPNLSATEQSNSDIIAIN